MVNPLFKRAAKGLIRSPLYLWALPGTCVGLMLIPFALIKGGRVQWVDGVLEVYGGLLPRILGQPFWASGPISAITLGHVVAGCDQSTMDRTRIHERVHVRQYERWGPAFIPVYLLTSVWIGLRGGDAYFDNPFEVEAYSVSNPRDELNRD